MSERTKDAMIKFRSVIRGKNSKGGDRFQLYLTPEETQVLINELTAQLANPKGAKVDMHISKKEYEGRTFDSAIAFVKGVSDGPGFGGGPKRFVPKATTAPADTSDAVARFKAAQVK